MSLGPQEATLDMLLHGELQIPYTGALIPLFRQLRDQIPKDIVELEQEEHQLRLLAFLHSVKLTSKKRKKRAAKIGAQQVCDESADLQSNIQEAEVRDLYSRVVMEFLRLKVIPEIFGLKLRVSGPINLPLKAASAILINSSMLQVLSELSRRTYVRFLLQVHDRVIPNLAKPLHLADFLVASFSKGGLLSILALNGLFALIQRHNLDFPQFYERFYSLLTPEVLHSKFRARFFYLADKFMSSSHVPAYTVAAVAKRLSRLSLIAPADSLHLLLVFTMNLIIRHPTLTVLLHRVSDVEDVRNDPYDAYESDMQRSGALESSLWELKTMKAHYNESIAKLASQLDHQLPEMEYDITDHLETTVEELVDQLEHELPADDPVRPKDKLRLATLFPKSGYFGSLFTA